MKKDECRCQIRQKTRKTEIPRPKLNHDFISIHEHDYLNLPAFLERLQREGSDKLMPDKTVSLFLVDQVMSMPYDTYRMTLGVFEKGISLNQYYRLMAQKGIFTRPYHENLIGKMFESEVLH